MTRRSSSLICQPGGSGIPRILSECEKEGLLAPQLQDNGDAFRVVFLREHGKSDELKSEIVTKDVADVTNVTKGVTEDHENTVEETKKMILQILMGNPKVTQEVLAERMGMTKRNITRYMKKLQEASIVQRIGNHRNGSWVVTLPENESRG